MNEELLAKARAAGSPEELLKIAQENGSPEMTAEMAKEYFGMLHKSGEVSDEELENAAGGCTKYDKDTGDRVVTSGNLCAKRNDQDAPWRCRNCQQRADKCNCYPAPNKTQDLFGVVTVPTKHNCGTCIHYRLNVGGVGHYCDSYDMDRD